MSAVTRWWILAVLGLVAIGVGIAVTPAGAQDSGPVGYYGEAETEDGTPIPNGTTLVAVADGSVQDRIDISPSGQYGTADPTGPKLFVDTDETVSFYVEKEDGTRIEALTSADPTQAQGAEELNIRFPAGTVASAPYFTVSELQPVDGTAVEGETVELSATLSNSVDSGTQSVTFAVDGQTQASTDVTLDTGESRTVNFSLDTAAVGTGSHTYTIASANESKSETLTVTEARADLTVSALEPVETTVLEGDPINASATVTNNGNAEGTQTVTLEAGGTTLASSDVTLAASDKQSVSFSDVGTDALGPGTYTYGVYTDNDSATGTLTVEARLADFSVTGLDPADATVTVGDELTVSATVANNGNSEGTQTATLSIDGTESGSEQLTLGVDTEESVTFAPFNTSALGPGTYSYEVASENDTQSGTLIVESDSPATFSVTDLTPAEATVQTDGTIDVSAAVTNDGAAQATQRIRMQVDGDTVARRSVTLGGGATTTVSFSDVGTGGLGAGTYSYSVFSNDDSATGTLTVEGDSGSEPTATFTLTSLEPATTTVSQGDRVTVTTTVANDGDAEGTQTVVLARNSQQVDTADVSLAAGQERTVSLSFDTSGLADGSHVYSISTDDDRRVGTLTVTTDSEATPTPTDTGTPTPEPPDGTPTAIEDTTTTTATESGTESTTTASGDDGGLLPGGLLGTVLLWVGVPLLVIYGILKALALYLGY